MTPRELSTLGSLRSELAAVAVAIGRSKTDGFDVDWFELARDVRSQTDEIDAKKLEQSALFDNWEETRMKLMLRNEEIDALKAAAIVQGSIKLDEAVKTARERERLRAEIGSLRSQAIVRAMQIKNLMAENARLRAGAKTIPVEGDE